MDASMIARQMCILFLMMMSGYLLYKGGLITPEGTKGLSSVIMNILNPCLLLASVLNKKITYDAALVTENILLVIGFFVFLMVISRLFVKLMRVKKGSENIYRLMMLFPNLGFMGIPLVRSVYGEEAVIFVAFYCIGYNLLVYSYGILLAMDSGEGRKQAVKLPLKKIFNVGMVGGVLTVIVFAFRIEVPALVADFVAPVGNAVIPLSMMTVGIMVAQSDIKKVVTDKKNLLFTVINLLIIPVLAIPVLRLLHLNPLSYGIFMIMISMPVGSVVIMIEKEYGHSDGSIAARGIALTSVLSVVTIPIISFLA